MFPMKRRLCHEDDNRRGTLPFPCRSRTVRSALLSGQPHRYPGGSTASGRASVSSDLDLVIIDDTQETSHIVYRQWEDYPVDALVLKGTVLPAALRKGIETGNPTLQRICAEGWVLRDDGSAGSLIRECAEDLACGPMPYAEEEIALIRYEIHDFLTDLHCGRRREEELFIVHQLTALVSGLLLRGAGIGPGTANGSTAAWSMEIRKPRPPWLRLCPPSTKTGTKSPC
ncbi:nucleotidyltransferase domain-containing protein [Paenibacillus sp. CC-CFT747]|nr:nucleotidyltransferase domain-containing protein [Paenibacillus sp. CC-CFT747]